MKENQENQNGNSGHFVNDGGGTYIQNFITEDEEKTLVDYIDTSEWDCTLKRRVQHYGYKYDYRKRTINDIEKAEKIPDWLDFLIERFKKQFDFEPNQVIINEYKTGQGIGNHTDARVFDNLIGTLSLLSDCTMQIGHYYGVTPIELNRRSLLVFKDESRHKWKHGIRKVDERRISITFRRIKE